MELRVSLPSLLNIYLKYGHGPTAYLMLCYVITYHTPNLDGFSPYELVFVHKAILSHNLEIKPDVVVSGNFKTCYENLKSVLEPNHQ